MRRKGEDGVGDYDDAFSPVPAASGFRTILSLATQQNMFTEHVDISQAFVQGKLLPGVLRICPRPTTPRKFYALTISEMPLFALHPCSPTRASTKTTETRILPWISIDVIVVLSVA